MQACRCITRPSGPTIIPIRISKCRQKVAAGILAEVENAGERLQITDRGLSPKAHRTSDQLKSCSFGADFTLLCT